MKKKREKTLVLSYNVENVNINNKKPQTLPKNKKKRAPYSPRFFDFYFADIISFILAMASFRFSPPTFK